MIRIPGERGSHPLQENEAILSNILSRIFEKLIFVYFFCVIGGRIIFCICPKK